MFNSSIAVDCLYSIDNSTLFRKATINECRFSRSAGILLLIISILAFIINIRCLLTMKKTHQISSRDRNVPSVVTQCILCGRLCSTIICRIEGFNSFFNGCITMYMLVALSIARYSTIASSFLLKNRQQQIKQSNFSLVLICCFLGCIWAVPPLFGWVSAYVPEGLGFHCGLNWFDRSLISRIYFFSLFLTLYLIPLGIIIYIIRYIHQKIYRLTHLNPIISLEMNNLTEQELLRRHISDTVYTKETQRLRRLYDERHFVLATGISLVIYLIAWAPYSIVALAQVFGDHFSLYNPWIMTTCALLAKLSMIINPIIYTIMLKNRQMIFNEE